MHYPNPIDSVTISPDAFSDQDELGEFIEDVWSALDGSDEEKVSLLNKIMRVVEEKYLVVRLPEFPQEDIRVTPQGDDYVMEAFDGRQTVDVLELDSFIRENEDIVADIGNRVYGYLRAVATKEAITRHQG